jgi:hypothetical protein
VTLAVEGPYSPNPGALRLSWDFGDGTTTVGTQVTHSWASAGNYTVTLTLLDSAGKSTSVQEMVAVGQDLPEFHNRFDDFPPSNGFEPPNPSLQVPTPGPGQP